MNERQAKFREIYGILSAKAEAQLRLPKQHARRLADTLIHLKAQRISGKDSLTLLDLTELEVLARWVRMLNLAEYYDAGRKFF